MPGYLQRLACAGARIVPSWSVRTAPRPVPPAVSQQETKYAEPATSSPPVTAVTACSGVGGASWPAPPVERLRPVPMGVAETPEQPSSPHELQAPGPSKRAEAAQSQIEAAAPDSGLLQGAREAKTEPQLGPPWTALVILLTPASSRQSHQNRRPFQPPSRATRRAMSPQPPARCPVTARTAGRPKRFPGWRS
jgi:hypothetical protein